MASEREEQDHSWLSDLVRIVILGWALACLSLNYLGHVKAMDPTFPASLLTGILGSMGVSVGKNNNKKDGPKVEEPTTSTPKK
ncbi:MAG: hypothetical protein ACPGES_05155 [Coraliomargarita sp.]